MALLILTILKPTLCISQNYYGNTSTKKTKIGQKLAKSALIIRCKQALLETQTPAYLTTYANDDTFLLKRQINYLEYLSQNLKRIIVGKADELSKIVNETYIILKKR
ncbi:hypothetical protein [Aeromonas veronii]|uniref:hypothetical protein n=1 Tax=Aeromonas veronii TaxID=654 RepID=UPI002444560A|nr:hypothetical protein [Aeromonas veronii]